MAHPKKSEMSQGCRSEKCVCGEGSAFGQGLSGRTSRQVSKAQEHTFLESLRV